MKILKIDPARINQSLMAKAIQKVNKGGVVIFPTDTVYGIGCQADNAKSIKRIYHIKNRDQHKPLPVLIADFQQLAKLHIKMTRETKQLVKKYWPGPLTLVLPAKTGGSVGVRMPQHPIALALMKKTGPMAVTSVNFSGQASAKTVTGIPADIIKSVDLVIDSGTCPLAVESTVVDLTGLKIKILRAGYISRKEILQAIKNV